MNLIEIIKIILYILRTIFIACCILLCLWFIVSYVDVVIHNLSEGYEYPSWNIFQLVL